MTLFSFIYKTYPKVRGEITGKNYTSATPKKLRNATPEICQQELSVNHLIINDL
jgi:hypothetical protein